MKLSELVDGFDLEVRLGDDPEVRGVAHDSRRVGPGDLFAALAGARHDGVEFVPEAVERGAVAVLAATPPPPGAPPWIRSDAPRRWLGPLAARLHGHPDRELLMAGVTGTNGKSTVVALLAAILDAAGKPCGRLGTLGYRFGDQRWEGERTTPEASDLFRVLARMRQAGAAAAALEVSSHALALGRVEGAGFDLAVFTNLSRDHFDFHRDLESYFAAKRRLFDHLRPAGRAALNLDDAHGRRLAEELEGATTYGAEGAVRVVAAELDAAGIRATVATPRGQLRLESTLRGALNLDNVLAAVAGAEALALPHAAIAAGVAAVTPLAGRMEPVECGQPFPVYIDYAHTPAALEAALASIRGFSRGRIIAVFGCGGDRDPGKRPLMGRVAGELADLPIITSDNPRSEDPLAIIAAVEAGMVESGNDSYRIVPDRREAIRRAVRVADAGSVVLVAGKGHEQEQIVGEQRLPFSDRRELVAALEERFGSAACG